MQSAMLFAAAHDPAGTYLTNVAAANRYGRRDDEPVPLSRVPLSRVELFSWIAKTAANVEKYFFTLFVICR